MSAYGWFISWCLVVIAMMTVAALREHQVNRRTRGGRR